MPRRRASALPASPPQAWEGSSMERLDSRNTVDFENMSGAHRPNQAPLVHDYFIQRFASAGSGANAWERAAVSMSVATSSGCETIATWLDGTSTVVAPIRSANCRSASGGSASSLRATRYQEGSDFHAGAPMTSVKAEEASACWTAYITRARVGSTSPAKWLTKSSSESQPKPRESVNRCASAGVTGPCERSAPSDSPSSRPKAAM